MSVARLIGMAGSRRRRGARVVVRDRRAVRVPCAAWSSAGSPAPDATAVPGPFGVRRARLRVAGAFSASAGDSLFCLAVPTRSWPGSDPPASEAPSADAGRARDRPLPPRRRDRRRADWAGESPFARMAPLLSPAPSPSPAGVAPPTAEAVSGFEAFGVTRRALGRVGGFTASDAPSPGASVGPSAADTAPEAVEGVCLSASASPPPEAARVDPAGRRLRRRGARWVAPSPVGPPGRPPSVPVTSAATSADPVRRAGRSS